MDELKLYLDNTSTSISGKLGGKTYDEFKQLLGYVPEDAMWRMQSNPNWKGYYTCVCYNKTWCRCALKKDGMHFPTGLYGKAIEFFKENGIKYSVTDIRDVNVKNAFREIPYDLATHNRDGQLFAPFDYQKKVIEDAVAQQRGIIKVATGGGKTVIASGIIAAIGVKPTIFYVTSTDLLKQAVDEFTQYLRLQGSPLTVGAVGGGQKKIADLTVMTVQTAVRALDGKWQKYDDEDQDDNTDISDIKRDLCDLIQSAKLIICDEVQHWAADTCQIIADNSLSCRWRYGLSATPWRDKGDDILIDACFGKQICDINASWLIQNNYLVKPTIAFLKIDNMKGEKLGAWPSVYKSAIVENDYRNAVIGKLAQNLQEQGRTTLILIQQIAHGLALEELIPGSVFLHGQSSKKIRQNHIDLMRTGHAPITIASTIFDEGVDVKPLNALIQAGGGKSATRALQRIGRVIRKYTYPDGTVKKDAFVYDFHDVQKYLSQHSNQRRRIYKTEPEFEIQDYEL